MPNKCNGWTNYETWSVAVTIDNVYTLYDACKDAVKEIKRDYPENERISPLVNILKNVAEGNKLIREQILNAAYERINYNEIARSMLEDY